MNFSFVPFLLLFVPILEIAVFILIGGQIGVLMTLVMIFVTAVIGSILLRIQGFSILSRIQAETNAGKLPGKDLVHGVMIMIAGVLLLTPGFVTDTVGFLLFVPGIRELLWNWVGSKVTVQSFSAGGRRHGYDPHENYRPATDGVVDLDETEYSEAPDPDTPWKKLD